MPRSSNQKLLSIILVFYANKEKTILAYTDVTATTAVYVIPCKF